MHIQDIYIVVLRISSYNARELDFRTSDTCTRDLIVLDFICWHVVSRLHFRLTLVHLLHLLLEIQVHLCFMSHVVCAIPKDKLVLKWLEYPFQWLLLHVYIILDQSSLQIHDIEFSTAFLALCTCKCSFHILLFILVLYYKKAFIKSIKTELDY